MQCNNIAGCIFPSALPVADKSRLGFTLIELSIVLVIIGLIVGAVFVGRELINAALLRFQISQIESYQTVVNTFKLKYNELPGDMTAAQANAFGMKARSGTDGHGDGDKILEACGRFPGYEGYAGCENLLFWTDLSSASLIPGSFTTASDAIAASLTASDIPNYLPPAKIGRKHSIVAINMAGLFSAYYPPNNYFALAQVTGTRADGDYIFPRSITPNEAYNIDRKIDDGLPLSGSVYGAGGNSFNSAAATCSNFTPPYAYNLAFGNIDGCQLLFQIK